MSLKILARVCVLTIVLALIAPLSALAVGVKIDLDGEAITADGVVLAVGAHVDPDGLAVAAPNPTPVVGVGANVDPNGHS